MDVSNEDETTPLFRSFDTDAAVPDTREDYQKKLALYFILASTLFERIAFYALMNVLFTTLRWYEPFRWDSRYSQIAQFIFSGTTYISTLIFAVITDVKLGRARMIIIGFALYLSGYTLLTIIMSGKTSLCFFNDTVHRNVTITGEEKCATPIVGTFICIAIGAGAVQSNMAVFGAEQFQKSQITSRYFDKYAAIVNIGSMLSILIIPYIQDEITVDYYFIPYLIAASMLFVATVLFITGWRYYIHVNSKETVIARCIPVVINAFQSWYKYKQKCLAAEKNRNSIRLKELAGSHVPSTEEEEERGLMKIDKQAFTFLNFAKKGSNYGKFQERIVDDIKTLPKAFIVFILLIPYWLLYNQSTTTFISQGEHMEWPRNAEYIVSWMSLGDPVTVIIGIIIFNKFVYKYLDTREQKLSIPTRFVIGMCFALISMCITGVVEVLRQDGCKKDSENSSLSIYTQLPQNIFIGFSQLFAMIASFEYAYLGAPLSAQSLFMSLNFCSMGLSSFISNAYINVFPDPKVDIDFKCKTDRQWYWSFYVYFFILAGLQLIFIIIFVVCQKKFHIVKVNPVHIDQATITPPID